MSIDREVIDYLKSDLYREIRYDGGRPITVRHKAFRNPLDTITVVITVGGGAWIEDHGGMLIAATSRIDVQFLEEHLP